MKTLEDVVKECCGVWPSTVVPDGYMLDFISPTVYTISSAHWVDRICSRAEFDAKAAELSGKPGWSEAPEWAEWLAQDESGTWYWYEKKPIIAAAINSEWTGHLSPIIANSEKSVSGTVLGDWRDTLERKPVSAPGYNLDDVAFKDEWLGTMSGFPPVGTKCEVRWLGEWHETVIVGEDNGLPVFKTDWIERYCYGCGEDACFRPLKSDRERWKDLAGRIIADQFDATLEDCLDASEAIYDALKSGELPTPK